MPRRSSKARLPDPNELAHSILRVVSGEAPPPEPERKKNPHAVALGRMGGAKGGKARAEKLSKAELSAIAKKAAKARWGKP